MLKHMGCFSSCLLINLEELQNNQKKPSLGHLFQVLHPAFTELGLDFWSPVS